nr:putative capsid [Marmot picobirnavirus]
MSKNLTINEAKREEGVDTAFINQETGGQKDRKRKRRPRNGSWKKKSTNADSWYNKFNQVNQAGKVSFMYSVGDLLRITNRQRYAQAGIIVFNTVTGPGPSGFNSKLDELVRLQYTELYSQQTAATQIAGADLEMYELAMDEAYSLYAEWKRIFGLLLSYSPVNKYTPKVIVEALGYNFDELYKNKTKFENILDNFANSLRAYFVPTGNDLYAFHEEQFSRIYADCKSTRAKMYAFRKSVYRVWQDTTSEEGSMLQAKAYDNGGQLIGLSYIEAVAKEIFQNMSQSESFNFISALLGKVLGNNRYVLPKLDPNYETVAVLDERKLMQIHNMMMVNELRFSRAQDTLDITQSVGANSIIYQPSATIAPGDRPLDNTYMYGVYNGNYVLDTNEEQPSETEIVHMSVYVPTVSITGSAADQPITVTLDSATCDYVTDATMWFYSYDGTNGEKVLKSESFSTLNTLNLIKLVDKLKVIDFEYAPQMYFPITNADSLNNVIRIYNLDNPTAVSKEALQLMNNVRQYSLNSLSLPMKQTR